MRESDCGIVHSAVHIVAELGANSSQEGVSPSYTMCNQPAKPSTDTKAYESSVQSTGRIFVGDFGAWSDGMAVMRSVRRLCAHQVLMTGLRVLCFGELKSGVLTSCPKRRGLGGF